MIKVYNLFKLELKYRNDQEFFGKPLASIEYLKVVIGGERSITTSIFYSIIIFLQRSSDHCLFYLQFLIGVAVACIQKVFPSKLISRYVHILSYMARYEVLVTPYIFANMVAFKLANLTALLFIFKSFLFEKGLKFHL